MTSVSKRFVEEPLRKILFGGGPNLLKKACRANRTMLIRISRGAGSGKRS